ncbi:MAG: S-adenosyl-l-methionine hydroxide adenosyltransferase family protein [Anaerolineae bacterium]
MKDGAGRIITLTTDFGMQDGHVGAMKGVMHCIAPAAHVIDISHDIPPQDIQHAGFVIMTAYAFWPADAIHLIVIDPGVGSERRAVAVQTTRGIFVAPDNGVLSYVLARERVLTAMSLTNSQYWHLPVSPVFHGRDIFGPAAAHLAAGIELSALGLPLGTEDLVRFPVPMPERHTDGRITAHVQHIDTFGNCTTDVPGDWVRARTHWQVTVGQHVIDEIAHTFSDAPPGAAVALVDSTGFVAIAVRNGNAARTLNLSIGSVITLSPKSTLPGIPS